MNFTDFSQAVQASVGRVIVGKPDIVELLLTALLVEGHVLIEDVPGTGKTTMAKAMAASLDLPFARIQFTPDLLPSDVTGLSIYNQKSGEFEFRPGPVFSSVLLADEINRATPRTQSALLEAMQERQVTADGHTYPLRRPFLVLATQNPIELEGTFPLPEAQQDRFLMLVKPGYPTEAEEDEILRRYGAEDPAAGLRPVATAEQVAALQALTPQVRVHDDVRAYIVRLCRATRVRTRRSTSAYRPGGHWPCSRRARRSPRCGAATLSSRRTFNTCRRRCSSTASTLAPRSGCEDARPSRSSRK